MLTYRIATTVAASALGIGVFLSGCSGAGEDQKIDESQTPGAPQSTEDSQGGEDSQGKGLAEDADLSKESPTTSAEDAIAAARTQVKNGTLHAIELDYDRRDGMWQYSIKILDGTTDHEVIINAGSGEIVRDEKEETDDQEQAVDLSKPMTYDEGLELAQSKGQGRLEGWKLESDDGAVEYQFDFDDNGQETEVTVNVESKQVTVDR